MQSRREFLKSVAFGAAAVSMPAFLRSSSGAPIKARPNIVFIMIDDLGWMDLHCQGNERLDTPNIDRLARQGMRFTDVSTDPLAGFLNEAATVWFVGSRKESLRISLSGPIR